MSCITCRNNSVMPRRITCSSCTDLITEKITAIEHAVKTTTNQPTRDKFTFDADNNNTMIMKSYNTDSALINAAIRAVCDTVGVELNTTARISGYAIRLTVIGNCNHDQLYNEMINPDGALIGHCIRIRLFVTKFNSLNTHS
ncbi:hypothetical protein F-VV10_0197 [Faustovirus]|nr:hypothetical protein F-VV10_0197 [Faustovirus]